MNLDLSPEDRAFREEVRDFLAANLTSDQRAAAARATSVFQDKGVSLAWQKILHARGWAARTPLYRGRAPLFSTTMMRTRATIAVACC